MAESCAVDEAVARKIAAELLQALSEVGQRPVAQALGVSDATISRMKSEDLLFFSRFLCAISRKAVPAHVRCYAPEYIEHLHYFARLGMAEQAQPGKLEWADGE